MATSHERAENRRANITEYISFEKDELVRYCTFTLPGSPLKKLIANHGAMLRKLIFLHQPW
jgi:hypothetical protein